MAAVPRVPRANTIITSGSCLITLPRLEAAAMVADDIAAPSVPNEVVLTTDDNGQTSLSARVDISWQAPELSYGTILQYQISFDTEMRSSGNEGNSSDSTSDSYITIVPVSQSPLLGI